MDAQDLGRKLGPRGPCGRPGERERGPQRGALPEVLAVGSSPPVTAKNPSPSWGFINERGIGKSPALRLPTKPHKASPSGRARAGVDRPTLRPNARFRPPRPPPSGER